MPAALEYVQDGDWERVRLNMDRTAQALNPPVPQARVYNNANISVANNTVVALTFNSEDFDNGNVHSTSVNTGRLTAPITGLYSIGYTIQYASNATGLRFSGLRLNGTVRIGGDHEIPPANGSVTLLSGSTIYRLAATDYVELIVFQNSGVALNVEFAGSNSPYFWMVRLGGYVNQGV